MGHVFDFSDARAYEAWCADPKNRGTIGVQRDLMIDLLRPVRGESVLDIGCGTGLSLAPFVDLGLRATGLDPSPYMLGVAKRTIGHRADLHRGIAEELPFDDNSFDMAVLMITLEFVQDPRKALEEACRVAKDRLFVGALNRYAIQGIRRRVEGVFTATIYNRARFFSVWELKAMIRDILGSVPVQWRTVCQTTGTGESVLGRLQRSHLIQRCPFGAVVGMVADLIPRYRTRPLGLEVSAKGSATPVPG